MYKLLKHEMMLRYRFILINIAIAAAVSLISMLVFPDYLRDVGMMVTMFTCVIIIGVAFFKSMFIFGKGLKDDSRYIIYTVPKTSYELLGSKLAAGIIQFSVISFFAALFLLIAIVNDAVKEGIFTLSEVLLAFGRVLPEYILGFVFSIVICGGAILHMFFSQVSVKAAFGHRRFRKLFTIITFVSVFIVEQVVSNFIAGVVPYEIYLKVASNLQINIDTSLSIPGCLDNSIKVVSLNVAETIFNVIFWVGLFIAAAYMLDKEMDI